MFWGLACGVPSKYHLLNVDLSRRARPLFHVRPRASLVEFFILRDFYWKEMRLTPSTPS